ncbi:Esterase mlcF [Emericellopsis cladophorae]|uniref:Esterase mlcF n=1 Tax=Emericellopsis cladophorae TaxID=2686198 RepID=A0A9P9XV24_9HYPO|nr:Esterase mlcF [Emericellopsis cladophorae]KAI6778346.1 Esterase mlcF [Emericellopsis cladophorae]
MANLRRELDPSFELLFVDGPFASERGPGVSRYHPGPYCSHTQGYSPADMAQAVAHLEETLQFQGPIDGIFGFSQGSALTLAYLYQQQVAGELVPVKFACLFSAAMPCSPDHSLGASVISNLRAKEYDISDPTGRHAESLTRQEQELVDILQRTIVHATSQDFKFPWTNLDMYRREELHAIPRIMYPSVQAQKIQTPTVHVWGRNDFDFLIQMAELSRSTCDDSMSRTVVHSGLHDLPKRQTEIKAVLRSIDWAMAQAFF